MFKKSLNKLAILSGSILVSSSVFASETNTVDYSALIDKIDFSSAIAAVLSVIALVVGALVAWKGGQWIIKAVRTA
ncbi:hypothetical protein QJU89_03015 [Pasteurella skyensis]|uniref:Phage coat protein n=1 Tax=Phocoenobacter skyensis TaxID=97481 RepID=A0AAJ6P1L6_9PAST|nr:hypothetical protein [Pasteurella skyensis]MDP8163494.1 hypothetical protein [Pasteurella skyensis]MDP8173809.1 hypothetical protein [Pasteurella skyensis]MDP8179958.1 hypothetical protein [Pasteurella skyensis]MDP8182655.1 hypothetical protein [Pasteurella skyensis]MDP8182668.1 hypothetical protein [Pasteurella skyensis]